jgi:hypothetical protein
MGSTAMKLELAPDIDIPMAFLDHKYFGEIVVRIDGIDYYILEMNNDEITGLRWDNEAQKHSEDKTVIQCSDIEEIYVY